MFTKDSIQDKSLHSTPINNGGFCIFAYIWALKDRWAKSDTVCNGNISEQMQTSIVAIERIDVA